MAEQSDADIDRHYPGYFGFDLPKRSAWQCHLFGGDGTRDGISWRPLKGQEPNRFWRWMQFVCFGNRWVKDDHHG